jgi:hypothetical protein
MFSSVFSALLDYRRLFALLGSFLSPRFNDVVASGFSALLASDLDALLTLALRVFDNLLALDLGDLLASGLGTLLDSDFDNLLASDLGALLDSSWRYLLLLVALLNSDFDELLAPGACSRNKILVPSLIVATDATLNGHWCNVVAVIFLQQQL